MKKKLLALSLAIATALTCFAATPDKYFDYDILHDKYAQAVGLPAGDYVKITAIKFEDAKKDGIKEIDIPTKLEGYTVLAVRAVKSNYMGRHGEFDKIIIPETVVFVDFSGIEGDLTKEIVYKGSKALYFYDVDSPEPFRNALFVGSLPEKGRPVGFAASITCVGFDKVTISKKWGRVGRSGRGLGPFEDSDFRSDASEIIYEEGCTETFSHRASASLVKVTLPSSLEEVRRDAFQDCKNLKEVVIPAGAKYVYNNDGYGPNEAMAFSGCSSLGLKAKKAIQDSGYSGKF
ncbi:leucine-rich repeat protein [Treponema socranskii]|uniref:hypothetical protein n=1 Tax=Treponema socranskii TaxID=53419 RepID=UPI003D8A8DE1